MVWPLFLLLLCLEGIYMLPHSYKDGETKYPQTQVIGKVTSEPHKLLQDDIQQDMKRSGGLIHDLHIRLHGLKEQYKHNINQKKQIHVNKFKDLIKKVVLGKFVPDEINNDLPIIKLFHSKNVDEHAVTHRYTSDSVLSTSEDITSFKDMKIPLEILCNGTSVNDESNIKSEKGQPTANFSSINEHSEFTTNFHYEKDKEKSSSPGTSNRTVLDSSKDIKLISSGHNMTHNLHLKSETYSTNSSSSFTMVIKDLFQNLVPMIPSKTDSLASLLVPHSFLPTFVQDKSSVNITSSKIPSGQVNRNASVNISNSTETLRYPSENDSLSLPEQSIQFPEESEDITGDATTEALKRLSPTSTQGSTGIPITTQPTPDNFSVSGENSIDVRFGVDSKGFENSRVGVFTFSNVSGNTRKRNSSESSSTVENNAINGSYTSESFNRVIRSANNNLTNYPDTTDATTEVDTSTSCIFCKNGFEHKRHHYLENKTDMDFRSEKNIQTNEKEKEFIEYDLTLSDRNFPVISMFNVPVDTVLRVDHPLEGNVKLENDDPKNPESSNSEESSSSGRQEKEGASVDHTALSKVTGEKSTLIPSEESLMKEFSGSKASNKQRNIEWNNTENGNDSINSQNNNSKTINTEFKGFHKNFSSIAEALQVVREKHGSKILITEEEELQVFRKILNDLLILFGEEKLYLELLSMSRKLPKSGMDEKFLKHESAEIGKDKTKFRNKRHLKHKGRKRRTSRDKMHKRREVLPGDIVRTTNPNESAAILALLRDGHGHPSSAEEDDYYYEDDYSSEDKESLMAKDGQIYYDYSDDASFHELIALAARHRSRKQKLQEFTGNTAKTKTDTSR